MAIGKAYPNNDFLNGNAVIAPTPGGPSGSTYVANLGQAKDFASMDALAHIQRENAAFVGGHWGEQASWFNNPVGNALPPANADAVIYLPATGTYRRHIIGYVDWSYDGTPTSGYFSIESPSGTVKVKQFHTTDGPGFYPYEGQDKEGFAGEPGQDVLLRLAAGGSGIHGSLNLLKWRLA